MHRIVVIGGGESSLARSARMGDTRGKCGKTSITLVDDGKPPFLDAAWMATKSWPFREDALTRT